MATSSTATLAPGAFGPGGSSSGSLPAVSGPGGAVRANPGDAGNAAGSPGGMLTTIAGLIGGILLRLEYNIADALVTDISQTAVSFTEVSLLPLLARGERDV
jgi:hypothetical protein